MGENLLDNEFKNIINLLKKINTASQLKSKIIKNVKPPKGIIGNDDDTDIVIMPGPIKPGPEPNKKTIFNQKLLERLKKIVEEEDRKKMQNKIDNTESEINNLRKEIQENHKDIYSKINGSLGVIEKDINIIIDQIKSDNKYSEGLKEQINNLRTHLSSVVNDLNSTSDKRHYDNLKEIYEVEKKIQSTDMRDALINLKNLEINFNDKNKKLMSELEQKQKEIDKLYNNLQKNDLDIKNIGDRLEKHKTNIEDLVKKNDEINKKLTSPDCCDNLQNQINEMNEKIYKMKEEQNRIKLNGFKDKIKGFLDRLASASTPVSVSTDISASGTSTGVSTSTDTSTDAPPKGSEKLVSAI